MALARRNQETNTDEDDDREKDRFDKRMCYKTMGGSPGELSEELVTWE